MFYVFLHKMWRVVKWRSTMELGNIKLTWTEIGTRHGKRLFLCDQIVKIQPFGETNDYETSDVRRWLNSEFVENIRCIQAYWWLRSPGYGRGDADSVHGDGDIRSSYVFNYYVGVRIACIMN